MDTEELLKEHVAMLRHHQKPPRNVNLELSASFSVLDRVALFITERVGTFGFFLVIITWTTIWLGWNLIAPIGARFDPAPAFVLWLVISNGIQLMLMPLVMIGQNLQGRHSELRAESDFEVNIKAEHELEAVLLSLEHQSNQLVRHEALLKDVLERLNVNVSAVSKADESNP